MGAALAALTALAGYVSSASVWMPARAFHADGAARLPHAYQMI